MKGTALVCASVLVASVAFAQEQGRDAKPEPTRIQDQTPPRHSDFGMAHRSQKATDLMGKKVINSSKENLGKLEDIVVDASSGRILYGVLSFGGFLGVGDKLFAIPWGSLELPADAKEFVLNVSKDRLKNAEGFDKSNWPNFADEAWAQKTYKYYDQTPYWQTGDAGKKPSGNTYRDRWHQRVTMWQKCSDLCGKDIHNMQNEDVGKITDCLVDPDAGRILYGVLAHSGKRFAIPWNALTLTSDAKRFQVDVTKEQLKNAPVLAGDSWPNVADERWALEVHKFYRVDPYWTEIRIERENR
jgi:sporulation protein YlmC with PRC-barrel domain